MTQRSDEPTPNGVPEIGTQGSTPSTPDVPVSGEANVVPPLNEADAAAPMSDAAAASVPPVGSATPPPPFEQGRITPDAVAQPKKPRGKMLSVLGSVLGILLIAGWVLLTRTGIIDFSQPKKVGECITYQTVSSTSKDLKINDHKCDDTSKPSFIIAKVGDGAVGNQCDNTDVSLYYPLQAFKGRNNKTPGRYYCIVPNLQKDKCYNESDGLTEKSCTSPEATFEVVDRISSASATCPTGAKGISYSELKLTFCVKGK